MIDVIIGMVIFLITILLISQFNTSKPSLESAKKTLTRTEEVFFEQEVSDIENPTLLELRDQGSIPDFQMSLDELIAYFYHQGNVSTAKQLVGNSSTWVSAQMGFSYAINDTILYSTPSIVTSEENSTIRISRNKITVLSGELHEDIVVEVTEVSVWQ
ncbi:MAG: hypothetical protein ACQESC_03240 [Nanobdellota archaeon]